MDKEGWLELNLRGMQAAFATFAGSSGARLERRDGVLAIVHPAVAERSVFNSVVYLDFEALRDAYDEIARAYREAGCAWTVWVPEEHESAAAFLGERGHVLDAQPRIMGTNLDGVATPDLSGIEWTAEGDVETALSINDHAYGYQEGTWLRGVGREPRGLIVYVANLDGRPAATVAAHDAGADCSIWNVATEPDARGKGLSTLLMRQALYDATQRGRRTSTLQATKLGAPVYQRCGYRDFGALGMWELRPPQLADHAHPGAAA